MRQLAENTEIDSGYFSVHQYASEQIFEAEDSYIVIKGKIIIH